MPKLYRCKNPDCPTNADYEADAPVCPDCQADGRKHAALITELTAVHYFAADPKGLIATAHGNRVIPCSPTRAKLFKSVSGERLAVTCPRCKASDLFKGHEAGEVDQHVDYAERKIAAENGLKAVVQGQ